MGLRVFRDVDTLKRALTQFRGIKVATWYETAPWVAACLRPGDRGYYLVQDIEESYCGSDEDAAVVLQTYTLGLKPITEGIWVRDRLKERFGLDSVFVSIGLDHGLFRPIAATARPAPDPDAGPHLVGRRRGGPAPQGLGHGARCGPSLPRN